MGRVYERFLFALFVVVFVFLLLSFSYVAIVFVSVPSDLLLGINGSFLGKGSSTLYCPYLKIRLDSIKSVYVWPHG